MDTLLPKPEVDIAWQMNIWEIVERGCWGIPHAKLLLRDELVLQCRKDEWFKS